MARSKFKFKNKFSMPKKSAPREEQAIKKEYDEKYAEAAYNRHCYNEALRKADAAAQDLSGLDGEELGKHASYAVLADSQYRAYVHGAKVNELNNTLMRLSAEEAERQSLLNKKDQNANS